MTSTSDALDCVPVGHRDGPPLYGRMMAAIRSGHSFGNGVRMLKLPLIFVEEALYAGAIAQFYFLTERLEARLREHASHPLVKHLLCELDLKPIAPGYEADLAQIFGGDDETWRAAAAATRTAATESSSSDALPAAARRGRA